MMPAEQHAVLERGFAAIGPVAHVMRLGVAEPAAGEAAPAVAGLERPPEGGAHDPAGVPRVEDATLGIQIERHDGRIARDPPGRFM
jgi:hypothetical protein